MKRELFEYGGYYHVYNRGNNGENLFLEERNYLYFLNLMKKYLHPIAEIYAYCLMKNHFHIVLKIKEQEELKNVSEERLHLPFSNFFNSYAKAINKAYGRTGSLFQEHLKRNRINSNETLVQAVAFVHLNPEFHKVCSDFAFYNHSSYKAYLCLQPTMLTRQYIIALFGGIDHFKHEHDLKKINFELLKDILFLEL